MLANHSLEVFLGHIKGKVSNEDLVRSFRGDLAEEPNVAKKRCKAFAGDKGRDSTHTGSG